MEYTGEQLKEKLGKLPGDIRQILLSEDFGLIIQIIGDGLGITPDQALDIEDEAALVLMGISHPKDFIRNIQTKIGVDEQKARVIAEEVNEAIFQPLKESLKIIHNIKDDESSAVPMPPVAPKPPQTPTSTSSSPQFPQMIVPGGITIPEVPKPSQNIFEQKLQGVFKMPKEETLVPQKPSSSPTPPTPPRPSGVDPYREPPK